MPFNWGANDMAFFSINKIHVIGSSSNNPIYFDLTDPAAGWQTESTIDTSVLSSEHLHEKYGATIDGIFYFVPHGQTWDDIGQHLGKYDPNTPEFDPNWSYVGSTGTGNLARPNQYHSVTTNGIDTIYIYDYGQLLLRMVDINDPAAGETTRAIDPAYNCHHAVVSYFNGVIYVFGGCGSSYDITKLDIGFFNQDFATATWTKLDIEMPATAPLSWNWGFSVVAKGYIYLGGYHYHPQTILLFNPHNESQPLLKQAYLNDERRIASLLFAKDYDDRIYVIGGQSPTPITGRNDFEYSNVIPGIVQYLLVSNIS